MENPVNIRGTKEHSLTVGLPKRKAIHRMRRAAKDDPIRLEQIRLLLDMQKHGAASAVMARQVRIVNRVRVQAATIQPED